MGGSGDRRSDLQVEVDVRVFLGTEPLGSLILHGSWTEGLLCVILPRALMGPLPISGKPVP